MTLKDLTLLIGATNAPAFRTYLTGTLAKADNGAIYSEEHLNAYVKAQLNDADPKKSGFNNRK